MFSGFIMPGVKLNGPSCSQQRHIEASNSFYLNKCFFYFLFLCLLLVLFNFPSFLTRTAQDTQYYVVNLCLSHNVMNPPVGMQNPGQKWRNCVKILRRRRQNYWICRLWLARRFECARNIFIQRYHARVML